MKNNNKSYIKIEINKKRNISKVSIIALEDTQNLCILFFIEILQKYIF